MAVPDHTTIAAQVYSRLNGQLVSTYASAVWRGMAPADSLPDANTKPIVVFETNAEFETLFAADNANITITAYIIRHATRARSEADTLVGQTLAALHDWTPTISGIATNPLRRVSGGDGQFDTEHAAEVIVFETYLAEGS